MADAAAEGQRHRKCRMIAAIFRELLKKHHGMLRSHSSREMSSLSVCSGSCDALAKHLRSTQGSTKGLLLITRP